jgi:hypothetical protein
LKEGANDLGAHREDGHGIEETIAVSGDDKIRNGVVVQIA